MILGRVIGHVWAARRDARLQRAKLLVVRPHAIYAPARVSAGGNDMPVDAAVLGVVDRVDFRPEALAVAGAGPGIKRALTAPVEAKR
jgi:microcompartment protein CcmK/EutM